MASIAWGGFWTSLTNNSKCGFLCLVLGFFLYNLWLLEAHYHHSQRVFCFCITGSSPKSIGGLLSYFFFSTKHFLCWICRTTKLNSVNVSSFPVPSLLRRRLLLKLWNSGDVRKKIPFSANIPPTDNWFYFQVVF